MVWHVVVVLVAGRLTSLQLATWNLAQNLGLGAWSSEPEARSLELGARSLEFGARSLELGARSSELGAWNLELGTWSSELGATNLLGTRNLECGAWSLELRAWNLEPGKRSWEATNKHPSRNNFLLVRALASSLLDKV